MSAVLCFSSGVLLIVFSILRVVFLQEVLLSGQDALISSRASTWPLLVGSLPALCVCGKIVVIEYLVLTQCRGIDNFCASAKLQSFVGEHQEIMACCSVMDHSMVV